MTRSFSASLKWKIEPVETAGVEEPVETAGVATWEPLETCWGGAGMVRGGQKKDTKENRNYVGTWIIVRPTSSVMNCEYF